MRFVRIFSLIAGFILLVACVNFMNLAAARYEGRAKEVAALLSVGYQTLRAATASPVDSLRNE